MENSNSVKAGKIFQVGVRSDG